MKMNYYLIYTSPKPECCQEHLVDHNAQEADRNKIPAAAINVASDEVASDSGDDKPSIATSDSERSSSDSDSTV